MLESAAAHPGSGAHNPYCWLHPIQGCGHFSLGLDEVNIWSLRFGCNKMYQRVRHGEEHFNNSFISPAPWPRNGGIIIPKLQKRKLELCFKVTKLVNHGARIWPQVFLLKAHCSFHVWPMWATPSIQLALSGLLDGSPEIRRWIRLCFRMLGEAPKLSSLLKFRWK